MRLSRPTRLPLLASALVLLAGACRRDGSNVAESGTPPPAEFIVAGGDSAYWVATAADSGSTTLRMRGAPLELVNVAGRWYELYVVDDDRSFEDALLVGERVYRRDLLSGDSLLVYEDSLVPRLALEYARLHPDDHPLGENDEPPDEPLWQATSTLELGAVHGPFASYSIHTDVERGDAPLWHTSHTGVLDLRAGRAATIADVAGGGTDDLNRERTIALHAALDSVRAQHDERGQRARATLGHYALDLSSFELTTVEGRPAVTWSLPGSGTGDEGHLLPLAPIPLANPAWWKEAVATLPMESADGRRDVWRHERYDVVARYDASGVAELSVRDSTSREWIIGHMTGPASRIYWLDTGALRSPVRAALLKAFREAAGYDQDARVAMAQRAPRATLGRPVVWRR